MNMNTELVQDIIETWKINNDINSYLLDIIEDKHFAQNSLLENYKIGDHFKFIYNNRLVVLNSLFPNYEHGLYPFTSSTENKIIIDIGLANSSKAIVKELLNPTHLAEEERDFITPAFIYGHLISFESYHRGQIILSLLNNGINIDLKELDWIWDWVSDVPSKIYDNFFNTR
jgi:hypothetical protein